MLQGLKDTWEKVAKACTVKETRGTHPHSLLPHLPGISANPPEQSLFPSTFARGVRVQIVITAGVTSKSQEPSPFPVIAKPIK